MNYVIHVVDVLQYAGKQTRRAAAAWGRHWNVTRLEQPLMRSS